MAVRKSSLRLNGTKTNTAVNTRTHQSKRREQTQKMSNLAVSPVHNVFVYGSLLADDVVRILLKRVPNSSSATLNGYHRFSIKGRVYPAILPVEDKTVNGKVLLGITDYELDVLDTFEDVEYKRESIEVSLTDSLEKLTANAYVWSNKNDEDLYGEWDFEVWERLHKDDFVKMTMGFMDVLQQPESKPRVTTCESYFGN